MIALTSFHILKLNGCDTDFSAKLTRKYPPRLPESRIYELLPRGYSSPDKGKGSDEDEREPPLARLRRLKFEMDELEDQLQNEPLEASGPQDEKADKVTPAMLLNQLKLLRSDWSRLSQPPPPIPTSSATQQGPPEASTSDQSEQTDVSDASLTGIADQVSSLEKLLGAPTSADLPPPILPTLDRLSHQLGLLSQPRHLDTLSRRIKTLVSDLERIHETRRKLGDTTPLHLALSSGLTVSTGKADDDDPTPQESGKDLPPDILPRLHALFTLLPRLQALMPLTPGLLLRLRSLAELHTSATGFNDTLKQVQDAAANVESSQTSLDTVLQNVQTSLQQNQDAMEANLGSIDQRIEALQQRITTLQT